MCFLSMMHIFQVLLHKRRHTGLDLVQRSLSLLAVSTDKTTSNKSWQLGRELMEHMKNDVFWHDIERNCNAIRLLAAMVPSLAGQTLTRGGESLVKHVLDTR